MLSWPYARQAHVPKDTIALKSIRTSSTFLLTTVPAHPTVLICGLVFVGGNNETSESCSIFTSSPSYVQRQLVSLWTLRTSALGLFTHRAIRSVHCALSGNPSDKLLGFFTESRTMEQRGSTNAGFPACHSLIVKRAYVCHTGRSTADRVSTKWIQKVLN
jgi:hypothetical protein